MRVALVHLVVGVRTRQVIIALAVARTVGARYRARLHEIRDGLWITNAPASCGTGVSGPVAACRPVGVHTKLFALRCVRRHR